MRRGTNRQLVVRVDKDDFSPKEKKEKLTNEEPASQRRPRRIQTHLPKIRPKVSNDRAWLQRYRKATSRENIKIEDETILDFLTHGRRRRGFIGRKPIMEVAAKPLDRLEKLLDKTLEKRPGRPGRDKKKFCLYLTIEFFKYLEDYSQKKGHLSAQEAARDILRGYLRNSGYPV
jgi:hypothetical protein